KEMQAMGGNAMFGNFPDSYNLIVNTNSEIASKIINENNEELKNSLVKQALDLAKLSQGLLKGEELTAFVKRNFEKIKYKRVSALENHPLVYRFIFFSNHKRKHSYFQIY